MHNFEDQPHLEQLRRELWRGARTGHAAVMVGSGFSRGADRLPAAQRGFPLWRELAQEMFHRLSPSFSSLTPEAMQRLRETLLGTTSTRLAQEFEAEFGRRALDELLIELIPDSTHRPGRLHRLLLELPWADVFTTNYDTLLERTHLATRHYEVVHTAADIPGRQSPRIFKLHGSFPSHRPFVISEEDFRSYPRNFAPFVNSVQQAMLERSLLLLGFSGEDPNFLFWSGWVRDQLGEHTPTIYISGLLRMRSSQKHILRERHIIPIDLSDVVPRRGAESTDTHHERATEWLLLSLANARPPDPHSWPDTGVTPMLASSHLPPLLPSPYAGSPASEPVHPDFV